jgi:hypothetical protein
LCLSAHFISSKFVVLQKQAVWAYVSETIIYSNLANPQGLSNHMLPFDFTHHDT